MTDHQVARVHVPIKDLATPWWERVRWVDEDHAPRGVTVCGVHLEPDLYVQGFAVVYIQSPDLLRHIPSGGALPCVWYAEEK